MKTKLLQEFINSDIKIKSIEKLNKYIDYCLENDCKEKILNEDGLCKSSHHHILPNKLFGQYSKLKENPWNGTHLMYSDHYKAHFYLTEAIDDYGQLYAFTAMHNRDISKGRITEDELIPEVLYQIKMEEKANKISLWSKIEIMVNGIITTNGKENARKGLYTKKYGKIITSKEEQVKKMIETRNKEYIDKDGNITSIEKQSRIKQVQSKEKTSRVFDLYHIDKGLIKEGLLRKEIIKISQALIRTTKEKYLGLTKSSKYNLINNYNKDLIGLYVLEQ